MSKMSGSIQISFLERLFSKTLSILESPPIRSSKNSPLAPHLKSGSSFSRSFCAASMQRLLPEVIKSA